MYACPMSRMEYTMVRPCIGTKYYKHMVKFIFKMSVKLRTINAHFQFSSSVENWYAIVDDRGGISDGLPRIKSPFKIITYYLTEDR
jgi:hypothetical protein